MKRVKDLTQPIPGDYLIVEVPHVLWVYHERGLTYYLRPGTHRLKILRTLSNKDGMRKYKVLLKDHANFTVTVPQYMPGDCSACTHEGRMLFLQRDKHPIRYRHEPNIVNRLQLSLKRSKHK